MNLLSVNEGDPVFVRQAHHDQEVAGIAMPGSSGNVAHIHLFSSSDPYQVLKDVKQREYADDLGFRIAGDEIPTENRPTSEVVVTASADEPGEDDDESEDSKETAQAPEGDADGESVHDGTGDEDSPESEDGHD